MRVSGSWALEITDLDLYAGPAFIRKGKGGRSRTARFGKKTTKTLKKYLQMRTDNNPSLWVTEWGDTYAVKSMQWMLAQRSQAAGIDHIHPHQFKKSFMTYMSRTPGVDIFNLLALSGNRSIEVVKKHYVEVDPESTRVAHKRGSPVDSGFAPCSFTHVSSFDLMLVHSS